MNVIIGICSLIILALLILGFFSSSISLFWIQDVEKRTRKKSMILYLPLFLILVLLFFISTPKNDGSISSSNNLKQKALYEKDIDLNSGDTIYRVSLFGKGPLLSYYMAGDVEPVAILSFEKCKNRIQSYLYLTLGEFCKSDTVNLFFKNTSPEAKYVYEMKSNKEVVLNVPNVKALINKINISTFCTLEIPIPKQNGRSPFVFIFDENSITFNPQKFE